ncbi:MAG: hypothetical protein HY364_00930 [Candidatus Aenigmarchaeota archaeon]|nr:hypothetical protein [Candidatus Aenigmarchaeota archaeon]
MRKMKDIDAKIWGGKHDIPDADYALRHLHGNQMGLPAMVYNERKIDPEYGGEYNFEHYRSLFLSGLKQILEYGMEEAGDVTYERLLNIAHLVALPGAWDDPEKFREAYYMTSKILGKKPIF